MAPWATTQYRQSFRALVATTIISRSALDRPSLLSISVSWVAKKARNSSGRCASARKTLGMNPDFSWTASILSRMSSGKSASSGTGKREIGGEGETLLIGPC